VLLPVLVQLRTQPEDSALWNLDRQLQLEEQPHADEGARAALCVDQAGVLAARPLIPGALDRDPPFTGNSWQPSLLQPLGDGLEVAGRKIAVADRIRQLRVDDRLSSVGDVAGRVKTQTG
jgi:hypothetical protein